MLAGGRYVVMSNMALNSSFLSMEGNRWMSGGHTATEEKSVLNYMLL